MLKNANEVAIVFELLDELDIQRAEISHVSHSKIEEFYREVRIDAVKAAKTKAEYLCEAIGEKCGSVLQITDENISRPTLLANVAGVQSMGNSHSLFGVKSYNPSFRKIKMSYSIYAKFEIGE